MRLNIHEQRADGQCENTAPDGTLHSYTLELWSILHTHLFLTRQLERVACCWRHWLRQCAINLPQRSLLNPHGPFTLAVVQASIITKDFREFSRPQPQLCTIKSTSVPHSFREYVGARQALYAGMSEEEVGEFKHARTARNCRSALC